MTNETRNRIQAYKEALPHMKEKIFAALLMLVVATSVAATATYAWVTLSRSPEVSGISTTLAANGALEIALSKSSGSEPDEFDIDESVIGSTDVTVTNLQWGNLVNLSDASYGIDNLALRPVQLNEKTLLTDPFSVAVYGSDGRITNLSYQATTYVKYNVAAKAFLTSNEYGVRAIATYQNIVSDATQQAYNEKVQAVVTAHTNVNQTYAAVAPKFSALGTMISKYAQDKLTDGNTNLASYISDMLPLYRAVSDAMDAQKDAYVALANLQNYLYSNELGVPFTSLTWDDLYQNKAKYNTASADKTSSNGYISLVGLTQFITDYEKLQNDIIHLESYDEDYKTNGSAYYWGGSYKVTETQTKEDGTTEEVTVTKHDNSKSGYALSNIVAHLVEYSSMTIDLDNDGTEVKVTALGMSNAGSLLNAAGKERKVYAYNGILYRLEQSSIDQEYRIGGSASGNAACTISVKYGITITVYGQAYTKASGACTFMENYTASLGTKLVPQDSVAEDTYGLAIDLWVRTNAEETCLTLEGATSTDEQGNIVSYDGINRVWGSTGEAVLTTDSTTQGGGSCYIYYADTPEDMARSLHLLDSMKVVFVDSYGNKLATAEMDTVNYWAVNGRITVPLVLDNQTSTTYTYIDEQNAEHIGHAITTLYTDIPIRVTAIVYLDGTSLTNDDVLAAAEIQGSLNIQFGSSTNLKTVGSNELIDDTRTVTATVSKSALDYDKATSNADLTTTVTVNIEGEGADPTTVTAFFVRAINATQGSREETMTFTKQSNGAWTCDYFFTAPGTYYLRQVRLDGVDYTLADPQKVEVAGFALKSVTWSETGNDVTVRTSDDSHSTTVTVQFASNDRSKLPTSVQARFVRDDGNTVNIPLTYNANGNWVGTGSFSASGVYQLQYLVANGRYIDLALNDGTYRTLDLSLGMYVTVTDLSGRLVQDYEEGKTYEKKVAVQVYNNAETQLEGLEGLVLYYSKGSSAANTIDTNLTWDELEHCYIGTFAITSPGRYQFANVSMDGNILTKSTESPVYTIISPDPPIYDETSATTLNDASGIQFVPLTNDAQIDGIKIKNADAAKASAVVYSAANNSYHTVDMRFAGNSWYVQLPTYNGVQTGTDSEGNPIYEQIQEGQWSIAAIRLWDCYDENSVYHEADTPILWVADDSVGQGYLSALSAESGSTVTPDDYQNFSKLTTTVSGRIIVTMSAGTEALGSDTTPFGTSFRVSEIGMSVTLTDGAGRIIPAGKIGDVTLNVSYSDNNDVANYGYKVSGYNMAYTVKLNTQDAESGKRIVSSGESWSYVGVYTVNSLTVTIGNETLTYSGGSSIGVPSKYTIKTAAPTAANLTLDENSVKQTVKTFGGDASNVTGTFLQAHDLSGTNVKIILTGANGDTMSYAVLEGLSANLILTYQGGSETYGGYTFSGDTGYKNLTLAMTEETAGNGVYRAPKQTLLAGIYKAQVQITVGGVTETMDLDNITVWSMKPNVKITGVSPTTEVTVSTNADPSTNHLTANNTNTFRATNRYDTTDGRWAVVYMAYAKSTKVGNYTDATWNAQTTTASSGNYADYTVPSVTLTAADYGSVPVTITIGTASAEVSTAGTAITVGAVTEGTDTVTEDNDTLGTLFDYNVTYTYETATLLGTVTIDTVTSTVTNTVDGVTYTATYTRTLANPITISQPNQANPTLTWNSGAGTTIKVTDGTTTYTGTTDIPTMTSLTATVTANNGYHHPTLTQPEGVYDWTLVSSDETTAVYTFKMSLANATLTGSATKYPAITFSNANNATVAVTVNGTPITSNTGAKAGSTVVVTVTRTGNYCMPRVAQPAGVTNWTANEGDFVSTYTFTMPAQAVSLAAPTTTAMYQLTWTEHTALTFYVEDSTGALSNGSYVVPGHTLTITLTATGGVNPELLIPADATLKSSSTYATTYTCTMPYSALNLTADADSYPVVKLDNSYATFTVSSNAVDCTDKYVTGEGVSIMPDNTVTVTLTAKDGYCYPRMTQPSGVTNWAKVSEGDWTSTYTFTMPNGDVDVGGYIKATAMPMVTLSASNASLSVSYVGYMNSSSTATSGTIKVKPNTTVSVTAAAESDYYLTDAMVTVGGNTLTGTGDYGTRSYTFDVGTSNVTLAVNATANPTVSWTRSWGTVDYRVAVSSDDVSSGDQVRPGTSITMTVTGQWKSGLFNYTTYYTPTEPSGKPDGANWSVSGTTGTLTFIMGTNNVSMTFSGS